MSTCWPRGLLLPLLLLQLVYLQRATCGEQQRTIKTSAEPLLAAESGTSPVQVAKPEQHKLLASSGSKFSYDQRAGELKSAPDKRWQRENDRRMSSDRLSAAKTSVSPTLFDDEDEEEFESSSKQANKTRRAGAVKSSRQDSFAPDELLLLEEPAPLGLREPPRYQYSLQPADNSSDQLQAPLKVTFRDEVSIRSPLLMISPNESDSQAGEWPTGSSGDFRSVSHTTKQVAKRRRRPPVSIAASRGDGEQLSSAAATLAGRPTLQNRWGALGGAQQRQASTGIRVTMPRERPGAQLVVNSRGLITAPKQRPAPDQSQRRLQSQLASLQIREHSLNPIGLALNESGGANGELAGELRPTFLRRPAIQLQDAGWQRRNSSGPHWVSAQLGGFGSARPAVGVANVVAEQLGELMEKQPGWQFQSNPPYSKQVQVESVRETTTSRPKAAVSAPAATSTPAPRPAPSEPPSEQQTYEQLTFNQTTISAQLNALPSANLSSPTGGRPSALKTRQTLLQQLIRTKLMPARPQANASAVTPAPLLSSTVASNVASLLAQKLGSLVRPALLAPPGLPHPLGSLFGLRAGAGGGGAGGRPNKHRLHPFAGHLNRRTAGVGSLLFQGFFYGLTMLPALMALTGVNPLAQPPDPSPRHSHQSRRPTKAPAYAYLVPLLAAGGGGGQSAPAGQEHESQQSALRSLYSPPPTVLGPADDYPPDESGQLFGAPSTVSLEHQAQQESAPELLELAGWPRSSNLSSQQLYLAANQAQHLADDYFGADLPDFPDKVSFASAPRPIFVQASSVRKPASTMKPLDPTSADLIQFSLANSLLVKGAPTRAVRTNIRQPESVSAPMGNRRLQQVAANQHLADRNQPIAPPNFKPQYATERPQTFLIQHPFALDPPSPPTDKLGQRRRRTPALVPAYSQFPPLGELNRPRVSPPMAELGPTDWLPSGQPGATDSGWRAIQRQQAGSTERPYLVESRKSLDRWSR